MLNLLIKAREAITTFVLNRFMSFDHNINGSHKSWRNAENYANISAAVDSCGKAGSRECVIVVTKSTSKMEFTINKTILSHVTLKVLNGGVIKIANGVTVTHLGGIDAGLYKIFNLVGTGKIIFDVSTVVSGRLKYVIPHWWGATANNVTDDFTAIQAAIDSVITTATVIFFPPGIYRISQTLTIAGENNIEIKMEGPRAFIRALADSTAFDLLSVTSGAKIDLDGIAFIFGDNGLSMVGVQGVRIFNCRFAFGASSGVFLSGPDPESSGAVNVILSNNWIHDTPVGIDLVSGAGAGETTQRVQIVHNNMSEGLTTAAIRMDGALNCSISGGNNIVGKIIVTKAVSNEAAKHITINGNTIKAGQAGGAVELNVECEFFSVSGNAIQNTAGDGLLIDDPDAKNISIVGNEICACSGWGINNNNSFSTNRRIEVTGNVLIDNAITGTADQDEANKLHDADGAFTVSMVGQVVKNTDDVTEGVITGFVDSGELDLDSDVFPDGDEAYSINAPINDVSLGLALFDSHNIKSESEIQQDHAGVKFTSSFVHAGDNQTMTGNETFILTQGNIFIRDPDGNRNFNPSGTFKALYQVTVVNTADAAETITFDSAGLNQTIAQNERGIFVFDGTDWLKIYVGS